MATWQSKLTKTEHKHLRGIFTHSNRITLFALKSMFAGQLRMRAETPLSEPCFECKSIARKLGFEV